MNEKKPDTGGELAPNSMTDLTRRDFFRYTGYGTAALTLLSRVEALQPAAAAPPMAQTAPAYPPGGGKLQLPFWSDAASWNEPKYYQTIQAGTRRLPRMAQRADINHDGQDELIARGVKGLEFHVFDKASGQWVETSAEPPVFSDELGWGSPEYYRTIQAGSFTNLFYQTVLGRGVGGIYMVGYDFVVGSPTHEQWVPFPPGPAWSDDNHWNRPQYYETIQNGYLTIPSGFDLIGRAPDNDPEGGGLQVWNFKGAITDPKSGVWTKIAGIKNWTDANGWNIPAYYQTIQCASVDGNDGGHLQTVFGQGPSGMEVWRFDFEKSSPTYNTFVQSENIWDANGNLMDPSGYRTIQFADIDGDDKQELILRGENGIQAWKFSGDFGSPYWVALPNGPAWSDKGSWNQPEYYETIQCADIDGDGRSELLGRGALGLQVWKFVPGSGYPDNPAGTWEQMAGIPAWSNYNGWDSSEYFQTIQTAIVNTPAGDLPYPQSVVMGRGPLGMQTWYYNPAAKAWRQTSQPYPTFTPAQQAAYAQLDTALRAADANGNIRSTYGDETADFGAWMSRMYLNPPASYRIPPAQRPSTNLPPPATNPPSQADWDAVTWQIYWEMSYVGTPGSSINDYWSKIRGLIKASFQGQDFALTTVGGQLGISDGSDIKVILSILELLTSLVAAVTGFPELSAPTAGAIAKLFGVAFSAASDFLPHGGHGFQQTYDKLQDDLSNGFGQTLAANANNQFAITGGTDGAGNYVPGDWGLISALGPLIHNGAWGWPDTTDDTVAVIQQSYARTASQALLPAIPWNIWTAFTFDGPAYNFPKEYLYYSSDRNGKSVSWFSTSSWIGTDVPPTAALALIFNEAYVGQWNPLGTYLSEVYEGKNGWNLPGSLSAGAIRQARRDTPGPDIRLRTDLTRDPVTGEIVAEVTLLNRGWTSARNVEITAAQLKDKKMRGGLPTRHTFLARSRSETLHLRFPNLPAGETVVLRVSGRYKGGTFGGSLRIRTP